MFSPANKPTVLPLKEQGKLTVIGSAAQLAMVSSLLGEMDPGVAPTGQSQPPQSARAETRAVVIRLKHGNAESLQGILSRLLSPPPSRRC